MRRAIQALRVLAAAGVPTLASAGVSCSDPVVDKGIERLGPEAEGVSEGPSHRPGQPCVLCHSSAGDAKLKLAIAGTIFASPDPKADGAEGVEVFLVDYENQQRSTVTNEAGNFYFTEDEWPEIKYPLRVGILPKGKNPIPMRSVINREPSCNFCHRPNPGSDYALEGDDPRTSIGQIYAGGTTTP